MHLKHINMRSTESETTIDALIVLKIVCFTYSFAPIVENRKNISRPLAKMTFFLPSERIHKAIPVLKTPI